MSATARSRDGRVELTVGHEAQLVRLHLHERTRRQPAALTARTIMETLQTAKTALVSPANSSTASPTD